MKTLFNKLLSASVITISGIILAIFIFFGSCQMWQKPTNAVKLGFPAGKKVLLLHMDDAGMCEEANAAVRSYIEKGYLQSAAVMMPCPSARPVVEWAAANTEADIGAHLTLTSEWKSYRWGPVAPAAEVPGLIDPDGMMWHDVPDVVLHATPQEVDREIRAQIDSMIALGRRPTHIDTHMRTLYGSPEFAKVFLEVAKEYHIPANALDLSNRKVAAFFKKSGYPVNDEMIQYLKDYPLPKLDFFGSVPKGESYDKKRENFFKLVRALPAGLTEIIFHPAEESENLKSITGSWQQRVWEARMFADPEVIDFFRKEGILFTNWIDIMQRFETK